MSASYIYMEANVLGMEVCSVIVDSYVVCKLCMCLHLPHEPLIHVNLI